MFLKAVTGCWSCVSVGHSTETESRLQGCEVRLSVPAICLIDDFYQVMAVPGIWILLLRVQDFPYQFTACSLARLILSCNIPKRVEPAIGIA